MVSARYTSEWLTINEVAQRYRVSVRCIRNWMAQGIIPFLRIGRVLRFNPVACDAALSNRTSS